jgi:hypothetical protein
MTMTVATRTHRCSVCERPKLDCIEQLGARAGKWLCRGCAEELGQLRLPIAELETEGAED